MVPSQSITAALRDLYQSMDKGPSIPPIILLQVLHMAFPRGLESAKWVQARHCCADAMVRADGRGFISQRDMALTQFGFMGFAVLRQQRLGLVGQPQGFIHLWRVIGYLMGVQDRFNLCGESEGVTKRACSLLASRVFRPALKAPPQKFPDMSQALLDAMRVIIPTLERHAFLQFTKTLCDIPPTSDLTFISKINFHLQLFVHKLLATSVIALVLRPMLNFHMWLAVFITQRMPFIAAFQLGREVNASQNVNNVQST